MKKYLRLALVIGAALLISCQKNDDGDGGGGTPSGQGIVGATDPIYGKWVHENPSSTSSNPRGVVAILNSNGQIWILNVFGIANSSNITMVFRKSIGTFTRSSDDMLTMKYSYETCNPVGTEVLRAKIDPENSDRLIVSTPDRSIVFTMRRIIDNKSDISLTAVEDVNCNLISKVMKENRKPASIKSVLDYSKPL